ncbi:hypothetical protein NL390_30365, partial [Klebsiella pneumoniae]|nr:hypothetical protein [Klebsiella pneumoniae]
DHEDFQSLNTEFKKRIAPPELIQQLIDLKLIAPISENDSEFTEQISLSESPTTGLGVKVQQKSTIDENESADLTREIKVSLKPSCHSSNIENTQPPI